MPYQSQGQPAAALTWDASLQASEGEGFTLLPEGVYDYAIVNVERAEFPGSAKMAPSPKANITLECTGPDASGRVLTNVILNSMLSWKITQLAKSCGVLDPGAPEGTSFQMPWGSLVGMRGRCRIQTRRYQSNGQAREVNDVAEWLPAGAAKAPAPQAARGQWRTPTPGSGF